MYESLDSLLLQDSHSSWLTIGDAGGDAHYLLSKGIGDVTASCIDDSQLARLQAQGMLGGHAPRALNAEQIQLPDESFDYVLCKEAYHHMPRPPIAFYEMLRVARKAAILIEPAEPTGWRALDRLKVLIKTLLRGRSAAEQQFETTGNFLFRVSEREIKKQACALQLHSVASRYMNDFYHSALAQASVKDRGAYTLFRIGVLAQDIACRLRLMSNGLVVVMIFKKSPDAALARVLESAGFKLEAVPRNPYVS
jgi:hypothetical protein